MNWILDNIYTVGIIAVTGGSFLLPAGKIFWAKVIRHLISAKVAEIVIVELLKKLVKSTKTPIDDKILNEVLKQLGK